MKEQQVPYKKGQSGHPSGRPSGISDKRTALLELLVPHAQILIEKTVELAKGGGSTALHLCLERIMAPVRRMKRSLSNRWGIRLPTEVRRLWTQVARPDNPSEAATFPQALATQARVIEAEKLAARLKALEEKLGVSK